MATPLTSLPHIIMAHDEPQQTTSWTQLGLEPTVASALELQAAASPSQIQSEILQQALGGTQQSLIVTAPSSPPFQNVKADEAVAAIAVNHAVQTRDAIRADETAARIAVVTNRTARSLKLSRNPANGIHPSVVIVCPSSKQVDEVKARLQSLNVLGNLKLSIVSRAGHYVKLTAAEVIPNGSESLHDPVDIMVGTPRYIGRLLQHFHPTKPDQSDSQTLHLSQTSLVVWIDGKELSKVDGGALIKPIDVAKRDPEMYIESMKHSIQMYGDRFAQIVVSAPLNEAERIGWGNEVLKHSSLSTSTLQWNVARKEDFATAKPATSELAKSYATRVWDWAIPMSKAVRQAQNSQTQQPFVILVADDSPKAGQLKVVLQGEIADAGSTAVLPTSSGNKSFGVIIYGPKKTFDKAADLKARFKGSGQDVDVLWPHKQDHHGCIETLVNLLHEAGEPIPNFMSAACELQVVSKVTANSAQGLGGAGQLGAAGRQDGAGKDFDADQHANGLIIVDGEHEEEKSETLFSSTSSDHSSVNEVSEQDEHGAEAPEASVDGMLSYQAIDSGELSEDVDSQVEPQQSTNGLPVKQTKSGTNGDETAAENGNPPLTQKPIVSPTPTSTVAAPAQTNGDETAAKSGDSSLRPRPIVPPKPTSTVAVPAQSASQEPVHNQDDQKSVDRFEKDLGTAPKPALASPSTPDSDTKSTIITKGTAAKAAKASTSTESIVPAPITHGEAGSSKQVNGKATAKHDEPGTVTKKGGAIGEDKPEKKGADKGKL